MFTCMYVYISTFTVSACLHMCVCVCTCVYKWLTTSKHAKEYLCVMYQTKQTINLACQLLQLKKYRAKASNFKQQ